MAGSLAFELPFPPSMNTYWRHVGHKTLLSAKGRQYRDDVIAAVLCAGVARRFEGRLKVTILACPPDRKRRDLDNYLKAPLDAMTHAGVWLDDSQLDEIRIMRGAVRKDGALEIYLDIVE
jgi:crossover junction endodeoxyribonuclease RusA